MDIRRKRLLDTFCGAGGCSMGYYRAGFDVEGVDIEPQPHYPFTFYQADALEFIAEHGYEYDVIHASPPCQDYCKLNALWKRKYIDLIAATRAALKATGKPYIIENIEGAPLKNYLILCGSMFDLKVRRHRHFECYPEILMAPFTCNHWGKATPKGQRASFENSTHLTVTGHNFLIDDASIAMGIDWMTTNELSQAIPPAYTEWIGRHLMETMGWTKP